MDFGIYFHSIQNKEQWKKLVESENKKEKGEREYLFPFC